MLYSAVGGSIEQTIIYFLNVLLLLLLLLLLLIINTISFFLQVTQKKRWYMPFSTRPKRGRVEVGLPHIPPLSLSPCVRVVQPPHASPRGRASPRSLPGRWSTFQPPWPGGGRAWTPRVCGPMGLGGTPQPPLCRPGAGRRL